MNRKAREPQSGVGPATLRSGAEQYFNPHDPLVHFTSAVPQVIAPCWASVDLHSADQENLLRSEEVFDVQNHPTMRFISTDVRRRADGLLDVAGDLTIRGITRRLIVPMAIVRHIGTGEDRQCAEAMTRP